MNQFSEREIQIIKDCFTSKTDVILDCQGVVVTKDEPTLNLYYIVPVEEDYILEDLVDAVIKGRQILNQRLYNTFWD